jgi:hypothetical protein
MWYSAIRSICFLTHGAVNMSLEKEFEMAGRRA